MPPSPLADEVEQPTNLLVTFLEYCSISLQDVRGSSSIIERMEQVRSGLELNSVWLVGGRGGWVEAELLEVY